MFVVSIEGIDGTGKSTLVDKLEEYVNDIKEVGDNYWEHIQFTRFPTRYFFERIANFNSKETITDADMLRLQDEDKLHEINKRRQQGCKLLICDRGEVSQRVYNQCENTSIESDFVIYLSIQLEEALRRISTRGVEDNLGFEDGDILKRVQESYKKVLETDQYKNKVKFYDVTDADYRGSLEKIYSYIDCFIKDIERRTFLKDGMERPTRT